MAPRRRRGSKAKAAESPARKPRTRARPTSKPLTPVVREERVEELSSVQVKRRTPTASSSFSHPTGSTSLRASTLSSRSRSNGLDGNVSVSTAPMPSRRNSKFLMRLAEEEKARSDHAKKFDRFVRDGLSYYLAKLLVNKFIRDGRLEEQNDATGTEDRGDDLSDSD